MVARNPITATISDTPTAGTNPSSRSCGLPPAPTLALFTAVTIARTSAPPNWNEVFSRPPARPCSSGAMPLVAAMFSGP